MPILPLLPVPFVETVLYVDFDGVLHHEAVLWGRKQGIYMSPSEAPGRTLFEWAHHLESIVEEFQSVGLVLSSSWCVTPGYSRALKRLSARLRSRFIGGTFHRSHHGADAWLTEAFRSMPRWQQILGDVKRRQPRTWLAIDDDIEGWPDDLRQNLVACQGNSGLSRKDVRDELTYKLRAHVSAARNFNGS